MYRVVRTRIGDGSTPNQVIEFETVHEWSIAKAIEEIWSRGPEVKAGRECVQIVCWAA
jgi:hypothetical protein